MAKRKVRARPAVQSMPADSSHRMFYIMLVVIALLAIVAIFVSIGSRDDNLTSWATIKSRELHTFMQNCRDSGGEVDVRPNQAPQIVFVCDYADHSVEYTLSPGK